MPIQLLQPGELLAPGADYLPAEAGTVLWGRLPCAADAPVCTVDSGAELVIDTISHEGLLEDQGRDPRLFFGGHGVEAEQVLSDAIALAGSDHPHDPAVDGPHVVTGPIAVRGAELGDLLRLTLLEAEPRVPYGVISNRHGRGALPGEYPLGAGPVSIFTRAVEQEDGRRFGVLPLQPGSERVARFPLQPFLGIMGVASATPQRLHSVPPGAHGGNIDIALLTAGTSLLLPVQVPGALAYVGDPHFAQGDGEVSLTALEASLRVRVRFEVLPREAALAEFGALTGPLGETAEFLVPTGIDADLDEAVRKCVRAAIALLGARYGMDAAHAYAYLSAATDFRISQVVDLVSGVHATIRREDFDDR